MNLSKAAYDLRQPEKFIIRSFPIVQAFEGIQKYENVLIEYGYLVVFRDSEFAGLITPHDLLRRKHVLAIDCCIERPPISYEWGLYQILNYFRESHTYIAPVFRNDKFYGIIIVEHLIEQLLDENEQLHAQVAENVQQIESFKEKSKIPEQIKMEFLEHISHEFRTPANAIVGFSELVSSKKLGDAKRDFFLNIIRSSSYRLLKLIDDLVELARVKAGDIHLSSEICSIAELFCEIEDETGKAGTVEGKPVKMKLQIDSAAGEVFFTTDKNRIKQVFAFLIDNAVKYSGVDEVTIGCSIDDSSRIDFFVLDKGKGIPSEKIQTLLEAFTKSEDGESSFHPGLGIGLAISKKIVELLGGELHIESSSFEGTKVMFSLPVSGK